MMHIHSVGQVDRFIGSCNGTEDTFAVPRLLEVSGCLKQPSEAHYALGACTADPADQSTGKCDLLSDFHLADWLIRYLRRSTHILQSAIRQRAL
jgi:hypothetical protein